MNPLLSSRRNFVATGVVWLVASQFCEATNRQRACSRCSVPRANYAHDAVIASNRDFAVADATVTLTRTRRKPFHFRSLNVDLLHMQLREVGLSIDGIEGKMLASGRFFHNGGDGGMKGSHVRVDIRAYEATIANASLLTPDARQIPPDAVAVWESSHRIWVPAGDHHFSLVPPVQTLEQCETLRVCFESITHLEVEISYLKDR